MSIELLYLALAAALTLLLRAIWMADKVSVRGLRVVTRYPEDSAPLSPLGHRIWIAHEDALLSLVVFAVLIGILHAIGETGSLTRTAAAAYFWARVAHALAYAFAVPWAKTLAYLVAYLAQVALAAYAIIRLAG